jgi:hypothetical protein
MNRIKAVELAARFALIHSGQNPVRGERVESRCDQDQHAVSAGRQRLHRTVTVEIDPGPRTRGPQRSLE